METKSALMLRVLFNRFHGGLTEGNLAALPREDREQIFKQETDSEEVEVAFSKPQESLGQVHYSWLIEAFQALPQEIAPFALASLADDKYRAQLAELVGVTPYDKGLSEPLQRFFLQKLLRAVEDGSDLPLEFLPERRLSPLAHLDKGQLMMLVDFLGLYDVANEIRTVVDKTILEGLYACLTPKKKQFLRACIQKKKRLSSPPLDLQKWDGDCNRLRRVLHYRGLNRLGNALCEEHPDFVWHLAHIFDTGRGKIIEKCYHEKSQPNIAAILRQQVYNAMKFLRFTEGP